MPMGGKAVLPHCFLLIFTLRSATGTGTHLYISLRNGKMDFLAAERWKSECGVPKRSAIMMITGGYEVEENQWPWVASLRLYDSTDAHVCAGALISPNFIATAAHCLKKNNGEFFEPRDLIAVLGAHKVLARWHKGEQRLRVRRFHIHPSYDSPKVRPWAHDLALVQLSRKARKTAEVRPVCLPPDDTEPEHRELCIVVGWGKTETQHFSNLLLQAEVPVVDRGQCNRRKYWNSYVEDSMLCAGNTAKKASACQGDSGGPLFCQRGQIGREQWALYGLVSWGPVLCGDKPSVYSNVAGHLTWITRKLRSQGEPVEQALTTPAPTTPRPRWTWRPPPSRRSSSRPSRHGTRQTQSKANLFPAARPLPRSLRRHRAPPTTTAPSTTRNWRRNSGGNRRTTLDWRNLYTTTGRPSAIARARSAKNDKCTPEIFERKSQYFLHGPSPEDFIIYYVKRPSDCLEECCRRGPKDCQSLLFFPKYKQCRLRTVRRCDVGKPGIRGSAGPVSRLVIYFGRPC